MKWTILLVLVACKSDKPAGGRVEEKTKPVEAKATDPACAAKAKELEQWLTQLQDETSSYEINFGWKPVVIDRAPAKVTQQADYLVITPKTVSAYDHSESNHVDNNIGPNADEKKVKERLTTTFGMKGAKDGDDILRIDVDEATPWSEVQKLVDGATQVGYKKVVFAFEATSKVAQPAGVPAKIEDSAMTDEAGKRLDEFRKLCSGWGYSASSMATALVACNCKVDPDEVRAVMWKKEKWHQAHSRVGVEVPIANDGDAIALAGTTPWSEAHKQFLERPEPSRPAKCIKK